MAGSLKKLAGFTLSLGILLLTLQMISTFSTEKKTMPAAPGIQFQPDPNPPDEKLAPPQPAPARAIQERPVPDEKPMEALAESSPAPPSPSNTAASDTVKPAADPTVAEPPTQETGAAPEKEPDKGGKETDITDKGNAEQVTMVADDAPRTVPSKGDTLAGVVDMSDEAFVALDRKRDEMIQQARDMSEQAEGYYGWGVVGDYETPDKAALILGGTPFAIDDQRGHSYRISFSNGQVKATSMVGTAYSATGIEARDPKIDQLVKEAVRAGQVASRPGNLRYYYLFNKNTERYILEKVRRAFEWFIQYSGYSGEVAEEFRQSARLRLDVVRVVREGGGQMGVAVPIYFDDRGGRRFMPVDYYQEDLEIAQLGVVIDQGQYALQ